MDTELYFVLITFSCLKIYIYYKNRLLLSMVRRTLTNSAYNHNNRLGM